MGDVNAIHMNLPDTRLHETTGEFYEKTKSASFNGLRDGIAGFGGPAGLVNLTLGSGIVGLRNAAAQGRTKNAITGLTKAAAADGLELILLRRETPNVAFPSVT